MEIAEETLQTFHLACNAIKFARNPMVFKGETEPDQDADQAARRNPVKQSYSAQLRRLADKDEVFSRLQTLRILCKLYFDGDPVPPFKKLEEVWWDFSVAAQSLLHYVPDTLVGEPIPQELRKKWEDTIWKQTEDDPIDKKLTEAMDEIQTVCLRYLKP